MKHKCRIWLWVHFYHCTLQRILGLLYELQFLQIYSHLLASLVMYYIAIILLSSLSQEVRLWLRCMLFECPKHFPSIILSKMLLRSYYQRIMKLNALIVFPILKLLPSLLEHLNHYRYLKIGLGKLPISSKEVDHESVLLRAG